MYVLHQTHKLHLRQTPQFLFHSLSKPLLLLKITIRLLLPSPELIFFSLNDYLNEDEPIGK